MAAGKRTRFALVFNGVRIPAMGGDFLKELDVINAEGCEHDGKQFVIFTTRKPRKAADVLGAISAYNATAEEKMQLIPHEDGPEVVVFDRGNCYRTHPICKIVHAASGNDVSWEWSLLVDSESKQKRVAGELETDLNETSIRPSASKRVALPREEVVHPCCVIGVYFVFSPVGCCNRPDHVRPPDWSRCGPIVDRRFYDEEDDGWGEEKEVLPAEGDCFCCSEWWTVRGDDGQRCGCAFGQGDRAFQGRDHPDQEPDDRAAHEPAAWRRVHWRFGLSSWKKKIL